MVLVNDEQLAVISRSAVYLPVSHVSCYSLMSRPQQAPWGGLKEFTAAGFYHLARVVIKAFSTYKPWCTHSGNNSMSEGNCNILKEYWLLCAS